MATAAVFGCTGLTGNLILSTLLAGETYGAVHTISRRAPKSEGAKLHTTVEPDTTQWAARLGALSPAPTTVFSALGTTRAAAGGVANQKKIDEDLNIELARAAKAGGARTFVFVSSAGTRGPLSGYVPYSRMKVAVEDAVRGLGFEHAVVLRPGAILGERESPKQGSWLLNAAIGGLVGSVSTGLRDGLGQPAEEIARAAVHAAQMVERGEAPSSYWVLEQKDVVRLGRTEWKAQEATGKGEGEAKST